MIIINLKGGIGSQLFLLFTGINLSINTNNDYYINTIFYKKQNNKKVSQRFLYFNTLLKEVKCKINNTKYNYYINKLDTKQYIDLQLKNNNLILNGYYINYKYFNDNYEKINKLLKIEEQKELVSEPTANGIALHFRFGDKYKFGYSKLPSDYYINAINYLLNNNFVDSKELNIFIFYEKHEEDKSILNKYLNALNTIETDKKINIIDTTELKLTDEQELLYMSKFKYFILAESSFSWWAQYLSNNKNLVIAPNNFFTLENENYDENKIIIPFENTVLL